MLDLSSCVCQDALMLFSILVLNIQIKLDSLNDPTYRPFPKAELYLGNGYSIGKA